MALFNDRTPGQHTTDEAILEQWGKCVDMANGISDKRISSNGMFLTIESALIALITFTLDLKSLVLSVLGIVVGVFWCLSIHYYKRLNAVKYEIINELEDKLPAAPFREEWDRLTTRKRNGKTKTFSLSRYEMALPIILIIVFVVCIVVACVWGQDLGGTYAECIHSTPLE